MSPVDLDPSPSPPGVEHRSSIADHECRAALRCLVSRFLDAVDTADCARLTSCLTPEGTWTDASGARSDPGRGSDHLRAWRAANPWSVHWFANEGVRVGGGSADGHWIWWAVGLDAEGPVWSAGDLAVVAERGPQGWRLASVVFTDRMRTSWEAGWLTEPARPAPSPMAGGAAEPRHPVGRVIHPSPPPLPFDRDAADDHTRMVALRTERDVRNVVAAFVGALDRGHVDAAVGLLDPGASLVLDGGAAVGGARLRDRLADDARSTEGLLRVATNVWCAAGDGRARTGWAEVAMAAVDGIATWVASTWVAEAVPREDGWVLTRLSRTERFRSPERPPWTVGPVPGGDA